MSRASAGERGMAGRSTVAPTRRALENVREVADEPVGDVERGGGHAAQRESERDPRRRRLEPHPRRGERVGGRASVRPVIAASASAASPSVPDT